MTFKWKLGILGAFCIAAFIALSILNVLIGERARARLAVAQEVTADIGGDAAIATPFLLLEFEDTQLPDTAATVPTMMAPVAPDGTVPQVPQPPRSAISVSTVYQYLLPSMGEVNITSNVESRYRGIVPARISVHQARMTSTFDIPASMRNAQRENVYRKLISVRVLFATQSSRGIRSATAQVSGDTSAQTYTFDRLGNQTWTSAWLPLAANIPLPASAASFTVVSTVSMVGGDSLSISPLMRTGTIIHTAHWSHLNYQQWLPDVREISDNQAIARWQVSTLASAMNDSYDTEHIADFTRALAQNVIEIRFIEPIDTFTMMDRSTKYGMFIVLITLGFVLLFDFTRQTNMHLVQYGVTTFGLVLFFMLLLSISEHAGFNTAFTIGAGAITALSSAYLLVVFRSTRLGSIFGTFFATIYAALYIILRSEDYALVLGSTLLLVGLAIAMWFTRTLHTHYR
jgi:inner membrane protein